MNVTSRVKIVKPGLLIHKQYEHRTTRNYSYLPATSSAEDVD